LLELVIVLFCVVEFDKSNCVDIVPSNWLVLFNDGVSQATATNWPPFKHQLKISRAVRNRGSPSTDWNIYMIRQVSSSGNYCYCSKHM